MRRTNWRLVAVGLILIVVGGAFFLFMGTMAPKSNDPASMMQTVGEVSGAAGGIGVVLLVFGWIGRKGQRA